MMCGLLFFYTVGLAYEMRGRCQKKRCFDNSERLHFLFNIWRKNLWRKNNKWVG